MDYILYLALFIPLVGFLILLASSQTIGRSLTNWIGCITVFISFICFTSLLLIYLQQENSSFTFTLFNWIPLQEIKADFSLYLDSLSLLMAFIITGVGFLIHVYSIGYMEDEEDYARFFACMNFFIFAMLLLVLAANLLLLFVGWEGVGLASYLLIGYYYTRPEAAAAATKAFVVNRVGDLGLLIGLLLTFYTFGTSDIVEVIQKTKQQFTLGAPLLGILTLLYFFGATGKSAQIPLHVWLPDAMEGPTPVSALIHAATMVTAGVYLVVRMHPLFMLAPNTMHLVGAIGGTTALFAALCAVGQTDLKRVLAYSTISQLGLMFLACGVGAFYAAMFHLTTHAFMKALLFLSAGNVVHMLHGTTEMDKMGGLSKKLPVTNALFFIGVLAMSGVPPLAAFFSKDMILEQDYLTGFYTFFYIGLTASIFTAFYLTRAYYLTFMGQSRLEKNAVKEAPSVMLLPLSILALLSIFGGFIGAFFKHPLLEDFLEEADVKLAVPDGFIITPETWMSIIGAIVGIGSAFLIYKRYGEQLHTRTFAFLRKSFFIDEIYNALFVKPLKWLSLLIDNIFEPEVFVGSIKALAHGTEGVASWLQRMQSGQIRSYVAWMAVGTAALIIYFII